MRRPMAKSLTGSFLLSIAMSTGSEATPPATAPAALSLKDGDRIMVFGDSLTYQGNEGRGFVVLLRDEIARQMPRATIEILASGIPGNRVPGLQARLDKDVLEKKPSIVLILIGVNDKNDTRMGKRTPPDIYETGLKDLIARITKAGARPVLCTPALHGEAKENKWDQEMERYAGLTRAVAAGTRTPLVDLRRDALAYLKVNNPRNLASGILTRDEVHLNAAGNQLVANALLRGLGLSAMAPSTRSAPTSQAGGNGP